MASPELGWPSESMASPVQLLAALSQLHDAALPVDQRAAAERLLLRWRASPAAWAGASALLAAGPGAQADELVVFAAQALCFKLGREGALLAPEQLQQLRDSVLGPLRGGSGGNSGGGGGSHRHGGGMRGLPLRTCCLALATLAALLPSWASAVETARAELPAHHALELLQQLAEEATAGWRHVVLPGASSSERLDWGMAARQRVSGWSSDALRLLHAWLEQQQRQQQRDEQLVARVVQCLTAWVKLGCLHQVPSELAARTVQAGLLCVQSSSAQEVDAGLGLLLEVPEGAPDPLLRALQPQMLSVAAAAAAAAADKVAGAETAEAAGGRLSHAAAWVQAFSAFAAAAAGELLRPSDAALEGGATRDALLQLAILPHVHGGRLVSLPALEVWASLMDDDAEAGGALGCRLPEASTHACLLLLLHAACNWMLWQRSPAGRQALEDEATSAALQGAMRTCRCALGAGRYTTAALLVCGSHLSPSTQHQQELGQGLGASSTGAEHQLRTVGLLDDWGRLGQQHHQLLEAVLHGLAAAAPPLRLHAAVLMAAAGAVEGSDAGQPQGGPGDITPAAASMLAQLLSAAAAALQQPVAGDGAALDRQQLTLDFCRAAQAWAPALVAHLSGSPAQDLGGLLQLLLAIATHNWEGDAAAVAAAAVRALTAAALSRSWAGLHTLAPVLTQAVQSLPPGGGCGAEQNLLASLSACLAAPGASEQQLQQLRTSAAEQLIHPATLFASGLEQQLRAGLTWAALASTADGTLCRHLVRVRAVLEAQLLQKEQQQQRSRQGSCSTLDGGSGAGGGATDVDALASRLASAAAMGEDDAHVCRPQDPGWQPGPGYDAAAEQDPGTSLLLQELWPRLHALVAQHRASGRFLRHYAKCTIRLLRLHPAAMDPARLQPMLQAAVAAVAAPGGCGLGELLAEAVVLGSQQGSPDGGALIVQALAVLWAGEDAAQLARPRGGDLRPDLAEALLQHAGAAFIKHGAPLHADAAAAAAVVLESSITAAAACACCSHRRVAGCALALLASALAAAAGEGAARQEPLAAEAVRLQGAAVARGAIGSLLSPSPLARLHKASAVLLELASVAQQGGEGGGPADGGGPLRAWLASAAGAFVPTSLTAEEAAGLAAGLAAELLQGGGGGGKPAPARARRLRKRLRDFAERHSRPAGVGDG